MKTTLSILFVLVCAAAHAQRNREVNEDLASIRPKFSADSVVITGRGEVQIPLTRPVLTVNEEVDAVLDSIDRLNSLRKYVSGYTIQIYSGQSREDANNAKMRLSEVLDVKADLQYVQPKFRVKVGSYFTALEAQKDLILLKRFFPNAILVPETIPIK